MKKISNKILLRTTICIILVAICMYGAFKIMINSTYNIVENNNYFFVKTVIVFLTAFMHLLIWTLTQIMPYILYMGILTFTILARAFQIGEAKKWKDIVSTIMNTISILLQVVLALDFIYTLVIFLKLKWISLILIAIGTLIVVYNVTKTIIDMVKYKKENESIKVIETKIGE